MVSARDMARVATESGGDASRAALEILAVRLFEVGMLSMNQAAQLAAVTLNDFLTLCDRLQVALVREVDDSELATEQGSSPLAAGGVSS